MPDKAAFDFDYRYFTNLATRASTALTPLSEVANSSSEGSFV
ncbi:hypothetical protein [Nitrobacter winogradskyi]|nr:hypothetical protein [Nitrobacter winogradskyi]